MKTAVLATIVLVAGGCASDADLVFEIHRTAVDSTVMYAVCDAAHPEDCASVPGAHTGDGLVFDLAIYLDTAITPPLTVVLEQFPPDSCGAIELDPAMEDRDLVVRFSNTAGERPSVSSCTSCVVQPCP